MTKYYNGHNRSPQRITNPNPEKTNPRTLALFRYARLRHVPGSRALASLRSHASLRFARAGSAVYKFKCVAVRCGISLPPGYLEF